MEELTKDQNDLPIANDTHIQSLNIQLSAIDRQVFDRQKRFQYCIRMFVLLRKNVIKHYKYQNTSGTNYKD
jgi:hypothetical protein